MAEQKKKGEVAVTAPAWFSLDNYAFVADLTLSGWAWQLKVRTVLNRTLPEFKGNREAMFTYMILGDYMHNAEKAKPYNTPGTGLRPPFPPLSEVTSLDVLYRAIHAGYDAAEISLVEIDIRAPDAVLLEKFHEWLKEKRSKVPVDIPQRGRKAPTRIGQTHLDRWSASRILPLCDLRLWEAVSGERFSENQLGQLVFPEFDDPREKVRGAQTHLDAALKLADVARVQADSDYLSHGD